jgi:urease accessory protein
MRTRLLLLVPLLLVMLGNSAFAHPGHGGHNLLGGFAHPFAGLDHLLAMAAVGLLAVRLGGRALWALPGTFVAAMTLGWIAAAVGAPLPGVEYGILASVLAFGFLLARGPTIRFSTAAPLVAIFAIFHGHAHATEMASGSAIGYALGMILATILLHAVGVAVGLSFKRLRPAAMRVAGAGLCVVGLLMLCGIV